jgi:Putative transposase
VCAVPDGTADAVARPRLELAEIVQQYGDAYRRTHRLTSVQHRALRAIYADHNRVKILTLEADDFLRRFLLHVVPRGFMRIRYFGMLANRARRATLTRCRSLLGQPAINETPSESVAELVHRLTGIDLARCPVCGEGRMQVTAIVVHLAPPDTS